MQELLEENLDSILQDAGVGKNFLTKTLFAQEFRLDKWYLMNLKKTFTTKDRENWVKR